MAAGENTAWADYLAKRLPALGHRNWIVIADAAYPEQSRPGIEMVVTGAEHLAVVREVLAAIDSAPHVRAEALLDAELAFVAEADTPGVSAMRDALDVLLNDTPVQRVPHEEIISRLDQTASLFTVLLLKTTLTIPYTSVFLRLECGYFDADSEQRLRAAMKNG